MSVVLVASIGFTVDFVVRRVNDIGRGSLKAVVAIGLRTADENAWRRVESTYKLLSAYLNSIGVDSELKMVRTGRGLVEELRDVLAYAYGLLGGRGVVEVFLTGGPRPLCLALMIAALTSSSDVRRTLRLVAYGEAFDYCIVVDVSKLVELLNLDDLERRIVSELARWGRPVPARSLVERLGMPRSTLYKKLKELEAKGLIKPEKNGWVVHEDMEHLI